MVFGVEGWRERQSIKGGETNQDDDIVQENFTRAGADIMGRQMFAEGEVGWPDPPSFRARGLRVAGSAPGAAVPAQR
ncbi:hypothetical protein ACFYM0_33190 [Streptomyces sp. NPDC006487]|uniref:hypothetical protein n=1 Tax=Streptomyces sp. NPDC006487 TaxID=3364748 RepID=UPI0036C57CA0